MRYFRSPVGTSSVLQGSLTTSRALFAATTLAILASIASAQAVKQGDPARRLPKIGIYTFGTAENFPVEPGQKIYTDSEVTLGAVAPELIGQNGVKFPKGGKPQIATTADIQLLIGYFRSDDAAYAKPAADTKPTIQNAVTIANMPPVDVYLVPFKRNNVKSGSPFSLAGTYVFLGAIPKGMALKPWDAKGGEVKP